MRELMRTTDPGLLHVAESLLREAGLHHFVADRAISVMEGSIGAFPRRLLIAESDYDSAREVLTEAGLGDHLLPPPR